MPHDQCCMVVDKFKLGSHMLKIVAYCCWDCSTGDKLLSIEEFCLHHAKVVFWKPDAYWFAQGVQVLCPTCKQPANHKAWTEYPRRVLGLNQTWFLYSYEYQCKSCGE